MFNYIIIGAGSAGCVLANRLSENPDHQVLLLEAGGPDTHPDIRIPVRWPFLLRSAVDWVYQTEPQIHCNNRVIDWNRGKVLGGTSSINAMAYIRGHRWDYDHWAQLGNEGWEYEAVLPYFKKSQNQERGSSDLHGVGGPLNVTNIDYPLPLLERLVRAALEMGIPQNDDFNGPNQEGVGRYQFTRKNHERHSTATAFLKPALNRPNLTVETYAHTTRLLFEGKRVIGVEYVHEHQIKEAYADQEIILSGGAINSPQILMLSGIGPADHLRQFDIPILLDLPGTGQNLQDHPRTGVQFTAATASDRDYSLTSAAYFEYLRSKAGYFTDNIPAAGGFFRTRPELDIPDIQFYIGYGAKGETFDFTLTLSLLRPRSHGHIRLRSSNPFDYPIIQPNYLEDEDDLRTFIDSIHLARKFVYTKAFADFVKAEHAPGADKQSDAELAEYVRDTLITTWHYSCTCKMGVDSMAVVDPQLRVYGVDGLRVVDASIMPDVIGGNTNAPVIMIAEKAADMILSGV